MMSNAFPKFIVQGASQFFCNLRISTSFISDLACICYINRAWPICFRWLAAFSCSIGVEGGVLISDFIDTEHFEIKLSALLNRFLLFPRTTQHFKSVFLPDYVVHYIVKETFLEFFLVVIDAMHLWHWLSWFFMRDLNSSARFGQAQCVWTIFLDGNIDSKVVTRAVDVSTADFQIWKLIDRGCRPFADIHCRRILCLERRHRLARVHFVDVSLVHRLPLRLNSVKHTLCLIIVIPATFNRTFAKLMTK